MIDKTQSEHNESALSLKADSCERTSFFAAVGPYPTLRPPFASSFVSSRALLMNSCACGPIVRFFRLTIPTGTRLSDCSR